MEVVILTADVEFKRHCARIQALLSPAEAKGACQQQPPEPQSAQSYTWKDGTVTPEASLLETP